MLDKLLAGYAEENRRFIDRKRFYVLDLHVSAMNPTAEEEARMMKMIESVKITKR